MWQNGKYLHMDARDTVTKYDNIDHNKKCNKAKIFYLTIINRPKIKIRKKVSKVKDGLFIYSTESAVSFIPTVLLLGATKTTAE